MSRAQHCFMYSTPPDVSFNSDFAIPRIHVLVSLSSPIIPSHFISLHLPPSDLPSRQYFGWEDSSRAHFTQPRLVLAIARVSNFLIFSLSSPPFLAIWFALCQ
ncbi:hypothetical protein B0H13DRAFT_2335086 [Mycena leptocephala]|nr:hypothetical protein B0H13DRAFT_2335086 [Mycena leptocephala]